MNAITSAAAGLMAASNRFAASAQRVASGDADYAVEAVEAVASKTAFKASLAVIRTADQMLGSLLDIKA